MLKRRINNKNTDEKKKLIDYYIFSTFTNVGSLYGM